MSLNPGYGETPVDGDELGAIEPSVLESFGGIPTKKAIHYLEQGVDGNGRFTRLMADLLFVAVQLQPHAFEYDWNVDKSLYIQLLRDYDLHRDPRPLASIITTFELEK